MPDWPNPSEDYTEGLAELKLRNIKENFNFEPETDSKGKILGFGFRIKYRIQESADAGWVPRGVS